MLEKSSMIKNDALAVRPKRFSNFSIKGFQDTRSSNAEEVTYFVYTGGIHGITFCDRTVFQMKDIGAAFADQLGVMCDDVDGLAVFVEGFEKLCDLCHMPVVQTAGRLV